MADHIRRQLREAAGTALSALATTGANVYQSRDIRLVDAELPALLIFTQSESAELVSLTAPVLIERSVDLRIQGLAKADADLDDTLDQIALEVETVLAAGLTISAQLVDLQYQGCDIEIDEKGEKPAGSITLRYLATLFNVANTPDVLS